ncbi:MAG: transcriptional regulator, partial [Methylibium sp.]|nr:transcriptional regulator [Methylibium sp.]
MLGPLTVHRGGTQLELPPSRKVRALLAYLALASHGLARSHLCELLWDLPNDPRGELRWCLSKLRGVLDDPGRPRVLASGDTIRLDLAGCMVDAMEVGHALQGGVATLPAQRLRALVACFARGDLLEGLELARSSAFNAWLIGQRRRMRAGHAAVLDHLVQALPPACAEAIDALEQWLRLAPFDRRAHELLLDALAESCSLREGEEHLAATARLYEAEGQDWAPIGHVWRAAKLRHAARSWSSAPMREGREAPTTLVLPVASAATTAPPGRLILDDPIPSRASPRRASLAVMPFAERTRGVALRGGLGDGLAHDVITRLAKLRSVFVIAQGTVFALHEKRVAAEDAGRRLDVDYVASGSLRREGSGRVSVTAQLTETRTARVMWAEVFTGKLDDTFAVLDEIGNRIVASIASQIELAERNRAILKAPSSLDAWEAHHRG